MASKKSKVLRKNLFQIKFLKLFQKNTKNHKKYEKFHFARKRLKIAQFWLQNRILREILALEHVYINIILNFNFLHFFHKKSIKNRFFGDLAKLDRFAQNQNYDICTSIYMSSRPKISRRFRFSSQNWAISSRFHDILNLSFSEVVFCV